MLNIYHHKFHEIHDESGPVSELKSLLVNLDFFPSTPATICATADDYAMLFQKNFKKLIADA